jgi:hypothetical protein
VRPTGEAEGSETVTTKVSMMGNTLSYVEGSGQVWIQLNWMLSLIDSGCDVTWVELVEEPSSPVEVGRARAALAARLEPFGLADRLTLATMDPTADPPEDLAAHYVGPEVFAEADLLVNFCYWLPPAWLALARRSALIDIDPGLLQIWMADGSMSVAPHDLYFSIGETVGTPGAGFPDCGLAWQHTFPAVHLPSWPAQPPPDPGSRYTTISHWWEDGWVCFDGEEYQNDKRSSFLQFVEVPHLADVPVELATNLTDGDRDERRRLEDAGWLVSSSASACRTPSEYRRYIQRSRAEFSCAKPSCMRLQNAWVSDRTLCYLASGRPAVVQHTGPSRFLPDDGGLLRFRTPEEAVQAIGQVEGEYTRHSAQARALAEALFDGGAVARALLERCL